MTDTELSTQPEGDRPGRFAALPFIPLPFLGLAAYRAWLNVAFSKDIFGAGPAFFVSQNAFDLTITLAMVACVLFARQLTPLYAHTWPRIACAGLLVGSSVLGFLPLWGPSSPELLLAATVAGGMGTTLAILLWNELYGRLAPVRICLYYAASQAVAAGLSWMYEGFKAEWLPVMVPLLPLVSMVFLTDCYRAVPTTATNTAEKPWARFSFPWKPVFVIAVYSFAYGLMQSTFSSVMRPVMSLGTVGCALFVVAAIVALRRWLGFEGILRHAAAAHGGPLSAARHHRRAAALVAQLLCELGAHRQRDLHHGHAGVHLLPLGRERRVALRHLPGGDHPGPGQRAGGGWVAAGSGPGVRRGAARDRHGVGGHRGGAARMPPQLLVGVELMRDQPATERSRAVEERASLVRACSAIAARYGLSQREEEVLLLLAQHKSATDIGAELCVAHGTAKAHIRHVYQKLDVHAREELFELVETEKGTSPDTE